jgi:flagellar biosynthesis anti-sigma factor FlgM
MKIQSDQTIAAQIAGPNGPAAATNRRASTDDAPTTRTTSGREAATVELSTRSRELHEALRAAKAAPDVRAAIVADVKQRIDNGTYAVDATAIARSMLDTRA